MWRHKQFWELTTLVKKLQLREDPQVKKSGKMLLHNQKQMV
jgi:hypothetical protein